MGVFGIYKREKNCVFSVFLKCLLKVCK